MKKTLFLLLLTSLVSAQNDTIWMSKFNSLTNKNSAEYYRFINKKNPTTVLISDFKLDGKKISEQTCNLNEDKTFDGQLIEFFDDGKIAVVSEITNSAINGKVTSFLKNGSKTECTYKNNILFDGKIIFETDNQYIELVAKQGIPVSRKYYNLNNPNSGYIESYINAIKSQKSFDNTGKIVGEAFYNKENEVENGILGEYSYEAPLILEKLIHYKNKEIIKEVFYLKNGNIREIITYNLKDKSSTKETFDNNGVKVGKMIGTSQSDTFEGKMYSYKFIALNKEFPTSLDTCKNGLLVQSINYDPKGNIISKIDFNEFGHEKAIEYYDTTGKITSELTFFSKPELLPNNGLLIDRNHIQEFRSGMIISDKEFYTSGELFSDKKDDIVTFFDKKGIKIGDLTYKEKNENKFYKTQYEGIDYSLSNDDTFLGYKKYKKGVIVEEVSYFLDNHLKNVIKEQKFFEDKLFDPTSAYTNEGIPIKKINFFKNGMKKFEYTDYKGYPSGEFYKIVSFDASGKKIGEFDKNKNEGTQCFYYDQESDDLESIETYKNGKKVYEKKFHQTKNFFGNIITKIELFEEFYYKEQ